MRERHQLRRDTRRHDQRRRREPPVVPGAAGLHARPRQVQRPIERRQRRGLEDEPGPRRPRHLQPVAQEPEPRHVGRAADPGRTRTSDAARLSVRIWSIAASRSASVV